MTSTGWVLHIDCKEPNAPELAEEIRSFNIETKVDNLAICDYWYYETTAHLTVFRLTKEGKVWCGVERKKLADLLSSIQDGRYKDQTSRILKAGIPHSFFLVVGSIEALDGPDSQKVQHAMLHLQMYQNIKVAYVPHVGFVKPFFVKMHQYLCEDPSLERFSYPLIENLQNICRKRKLDTHKDVFPAQLMCIHGVSEGKATVICAVYCDFAALIQAYGALPEEKQKIAMLKDLQAGGKKIGPVLSERIFRCVMRKDMDELSERTAKRRKKLDFQ